MFVAKGKTIISNGWKATDNALRLVLKNKSESDLLHDTDHDGDESLPELAEGQVFRSAVATIKKGKTSPPARFNDATLLSAMESAGADGFPDDAERKGLGTPATRAATIEKLIKTGFVLRQKKSIVPTEKGINLIQVLPDDIKSPLLTAEWEQKLMLIEHGEMSDSDFMHGIEEQVRGIVAEYSSPVPEHLALFSSNHSGGENNSVTKSDGIIGSCPRCGADVAIKTKSSKLPDYYCTNRSCKFAMWLVNRFFSAKRKKLDKKTATTLLAEGRVFFSDLYSERTDKTYAATIVLDDDGERVNYKLEFNNEKGGERK
jgi:DNA topoisomerase-3